MTSAGIAALCDSGAFKKLADEAEYERFAAARAALPSPVERHFDEAIGEVKRLEEGKHSATKPPRRAKPEADAPRNKPRKKKGGDQ